MEFNSCDLANSDRVNESKNDLEDSHKRTSLNYLEGINMGSTGSLPMNSAQQIRTK